MTRQYVTDPTELSQLNMPIQNNSSSSQNVSSSQYVSDPQELAQLNAPINSSVNSQEGISQYKPMNDPLVQFLISGAYGASQIPTVANAISNKKLPDTYPPTGSVAPVPSSWMNFPAGYQSAPTGDVNKAIENKLGIQPTFANNVAETMGGFAGPAFKIGSALLTKGIPFSIQMAKDGVQGITKIANHIDDLATNGYKGINSVGDQLAVSPEQLGTTAGVSPTSGSVFSAKIQKMMAENPSLAKQFKNDPTMTGFDNNESVRDMFPDKWLNNFEDPEVGWSDSSNIRKSFDKFTTNPTFTNADELKKSFNDLDPEKLTQDQKDLMNQGKNFVRDNIIQPGLNKIDPELSEDYMNADSAYAVKKQISESTDKMNNLIRGTTIDQSPNKVLGILEPIIENRKILSPEQSATEFGQLYNSHMGNIQDFYNSLSQQLARENAPPSFLKKYGTGAAINVASSVGGNALASYFHHKINQ